MVLTLCVGVVTCVETLRNLEVDVDPSPLALAARESKSVLGCDWYAPVYVMTLMVRSHDRKLVRGTTRFVFN